MATLEIKHTPVFDKNINYINNKEVRFIINQGGSRSSKTYSLCQLLVVYCLTNKDKVVSIIRKSFPSLRGSVMRDFFEVMRDLDLYNQNEHNKTENLYTFSNGSTVEFFAVDDEQKLRGRKRDVLWANEANELNFEEFNQLNMRTSEKLIFDFNPSDNYHWLYDLMLREESVLIHSTYKDNPFLSESQVKEIENLINVDEGYYRVYALGEKSTGKTTIYTHHKYYDTDFESKEIVYGLDFGYNHPTSLIKCTFDDSKVYCKEMIYESHMTSTDLVNRLKKLEIKKSDEIICDTARPEIIEDLRRAGYNAKEANKQVKAGIDSVKSSELYIHKESLNLIKEINNYKWKTNGDIVLDEPVKVYDDAMDAMRYGIHWWKERNKRSNPNSFKIFY
jgi:phage terminase large subunit